jgi:Holliday junction resolvase RusA-like endonuclease
MGGDLGQADRPFELDLSPAPAQSVDPRLAVGVPTEPGSRRTLLAGVALPLSPSVNAYWGTRTVWTDKGPNGTRLDKKRPISVTYVTHEGKAYQQTIRERMLELGAWWRSPHPLCLRILVCFKDEREQDISNRIKVLEDALQNGNVFENDSQVKRLEVREGPKIKGGAVFVAIHEIVPDKVANLAWIKGDL